jgi:5-methylcytosine-specific restriction endonuclease McrA
MPYKNRKKQLKFQRNHYQQNKAKYDARREAVRKRNKEYVWQYLQDKSCMECGEADPIVLEFDHRNPKEKDCSIADAMHIRMFSLVRLQKEIYKCDILCANCHRRKTAKQLGYFKDKRTNKD